jgi:hypothetical protein
MMGQIKTPIYRSASPVVPELFEKGSRVWLKSCPFGEAGLVEKTRRGKVQVRWRGLQFVGHYKAASLVLTEGDK